MINLLPLEQKREIEKAHRFRLATVYVFFLALTLLIGVVSLLPAYFITDIKEKAALEEVSILENSTESTEREQINAELLQAKELLSALTGEESRTPFYNVVEEIASYTGDSIELTNMSYVRAFGEAESTVSIGGRALTRDDLLAFTSALKEDELFNEVVLPVSSLAKDQDIEFNIEIKGIF